MVSKRKVNKHKEKHALIRSAVSWAVPGRDFGCCGWTKDWQFIEKSMTRGLAHVSCQVPFASTTSFSFCLFRYRGWLNVQRKFFFLLFF